MAESKCCAKCSQHFPESALVQKSANYHLCPLCNRLTAYLARLEIPSAFNTLSDTEVASFYVGARDTVKCAGNAHVVTSPVPGIVADCRQVENGDYYIFVQPYDRAPGFGSTVKGELWTLTAAAKPVPVRFRSRQPVLCASFWSFDDNGLLVLP
ncbi:unnamed protein product [Symbiodinium sp. CCMP2592]|nr:unnamed protein product [Symbiodinium sp. CCMP2592]